MKLWLHGIELLVDEMIPLLLMALIFFMIIEEIFPESNIVRLSVDIYDGILVLFFVSDLVFKYKRTRNTAVFIKKYWLLIIASFPLFLVVRFLEVFGIAREAREAQQMAQSIRRLRGAARSSRLLRFLEFSRFKKIKKFWVKPTGRHHRHGKHKSRK